MRRRQLWLAGMAICALLVPWLGNVFYPWPYQTSFLSAGRTYGVSPYLLAAVARAESRFDPTAHSQRGAIGMLQILPQTAAYLTKQPLADQAQALLRPSYSIAVGAEYLSLLRREFHSDSAAVAAYNGGDATVREWISQGIWRPGESTRKIPYPETAAFVERVRRYARWYEFLYPGRAAPGAH
ncbi:MAG: lytic transglycosylase domain-containing protein [Thermaerobacter sp.]|nr:lytic transglycosylase domain-containing protein [Thermaerobacter sp.]